MSFSRFVDVNRLFLVADQDKDGVVGVEDARRFFAGAGITGQTLGMIWQITVVEKGMRVLTRENFVNALLLVSVAQSSPGEPLMQDRATIAGLLVSPQVPPPHFVEVSDVEWERYESVFRAHCDPVTGLVSGSTAAGLFSRFLIGRQTLSRIWDLADMDKDGSLSCTEFAVSMALIAQTVSGGPTALPDVVPSTLLASILDHATGIGHKAQSPRFSTSFSTAMTGNMPSPMPPMKPAATASSSSSSVPSRTQSYTQIPTANLVSFTDQEVALPTTATTIITTTTTTPLKPMQSIDLLLFDTPAQPATVQQPQNRTTVVNLEKQKQQQQQQWVWMEENAKDDISKSFNKSVKEEEEEAAMARELRAAQKLQSEVKAVRTRIATKKARLAQLQEQNRAVEGRCAGAAAGLAEARDERAVQEGKVAKLEHATEETRARVGEMEEEAAALREALKVLERRREELSRELTERTRGLVAAGTRRASCVKILNEERGKLAATEAGSLDDETSGRRGGGGEGGGVPHHQNVFPSGRIFGPGYVSRSNSSIDPFDFTDVVVNPTDEGGEDMWCYEPLKI